MSWMPRWMTSTGCSNRDQIDHSATSSRYPTMANQCAIDVSSLPTATRSAPNRLEKISRTAGIS